VQFRVTQSDNSAGVIRGGVTFMEENSRCINNLYSVFDLPNEGELSVEGNEPTRVIMIYDRDLNLRKFEVVNSGLPAEAKNMITSWLQKNSHICDAIHGIS